LDSEMPLAYKHFASCNVFALLLLACSAPTVLNTRG
jgi:hypothetical protein